MAKSKAQKQQEAGWRAIRVQLVEAFRAGNDDKVLFEYGQYFIEKREKLWLEYMALPQTWRDTALNGWRVPDNLQDRLDLEEIEQQARDLDAATSAASTTRPRARF